MFAAMQLGDFVLADKQLSARQFFDHVTDPCIVQIVQVAGDYELSAPQLAKNTQFWVSDKHRQKRVLFHSKNDRYISISLDSPTKFHIVYRHAAGPPSTLKELFKNTRNVGDVKVALDDDPDVTLSNRPDLTNAVAYGELTAVAMIEETCLVGQTINGSTLESRLTLISTKAPLLLDLVVGIRKRSSSYFRQWTDALRQQQIHPSPVLLTAPPSSSDIVLLCDSDGSQHSSLLYVIRKDSTDAKSDHLSQVTPHLESSDNSSPGNVGSTAAMEQKAPNNRLDVESIRKRFEKSGPSGGDNARSAQRVLQGLPSRTLSERVADLPPSVCNFRTQKKTRSLSQEFLLDDCFPASEAGYPMTRTHTRSMGNVLDIDHEPRSPADPPPSTAGNDWSNGEDGGYDSIREISEQFQASLQFSAESKTKNPADFAAAVPAAKNKVPRPPLPDPRTPSADTRAKPKPVKPKSGTGLRRKKKDKTPPAEQLYEDIRHARTGDHQYVQLMDPRSSGVLPEKRRKWKDASEIPRDVDVASLTVDEVAHCLELLKLRKYARKFKERVVDGAVLVTVTEPMLVESFKMDQIDARKLVMFAKENWRPSR